MSENIAVIDGGRAIQKKSINLINKANTLKAPEGQTFYLVNNELIGEEKEKYLLSGADVVYANRNERNSLKEFAEQCCEVVKKYFITVILLLENDENREIAGRIAIKMGASFVTDCIEVSKNSDYGYIFQRTALNQSAIVQIIAKDTNRMVAVMKNGSTESHKLIHYESQVTYFPENRKRGQDDMEVLERRKGEQADNTSSKYVIGIGRGILTCKTRDTIRKLAEMYGFSLVGTKAAVDSGFIEETKKAGQSGLSISPQIYLAFGISGASQRMYFKILGSTK